jgi:hypothetical protein
VKPIAEWRDVDAALFRGEIATRYEPAVLRGLVKDWPAVTHGRKSSESFYSYLAAFDKGHPVDVIRMPPSAHGRIFYNEALDGFNFTRDRGAISSVIRSLAREARFEKPSAVVVQSAPIAECVPAFAGENVLAILDPAVAPRIWFGNAVVTPAHFDESHNVACVVAGRRRFTLFPPEQIANLYIGPLGYAPTGTPISLVDFREPDFARFPRFKEALENAWVADLEPGDAIYIPALWWHHVQSLDKCNALVNYWWRESIGAAGKASSALNPLLQAILDLRHLPPAQREAWRRIFDHYVFTPDEDVAAHIPQARRGVLGPISPQLAQQVRAFLASQLEDTK